MAVSHPHPELTAPRGALMEPAQKNAVLDARLAAAGLVLGVMHLALNLGLAYQRVRNIRMRLPC